MQNWKAKLIFSIISTHGKLCIIHIYKKTLGMSSACLRKIKIKFHLISQIENLKKKMIGILNYT